MSNQMTPFHPERQADAQRQILPSNAQDGERQQARPPALPYLLLLPAGFLVIAMLYGFVIIQLGLFNIK